jgi:hypothetical protein
MTTVAKSQTAANNCTNGIANLCCPSNQNGEQNGIQKKLVKVIDPLNTLTMRDRERAPLKSPPPPPSNGNSTSDNNSDSPADVFSKMKIVEDESSAHGIKLTDVGLPHISVQTIECKKNEKPQTTIIIYKSKNGTRAPTAKVIVTKVSNFSICIPVVIILHVSSFFPLLVTDRV